MAAVSVFGEMIYLRARDAQEAIPCTGSEQPSPNYWTKSVTFARRVLQRRDCPGAMVLPNREPRRFFLRGLTPFEKGRRRHIRSHYTARAVIRFPPRSEGGVFGHSMSTAHVAIQE